MASPEEWCVIFNPAAGRQQASGRLEQLRQSLGSRAVFRPTQGPGHAGELAEEAARSGFRVVAAAGGDGTVHEVANGLLRAGRPDTHFGVIPLGSANDYAHSLTLDESFSQPASGDARLLDVGLVRAPEGRERFFVCCLGMGLNGAVTLESRRIRRLRGVALYGLATLRALWYHYQCPVIQVSLDDQPPVEGPTLMFSLLLGRREGGFVMAPRAKLDDGLFDYVQAGKLSRWEVLRFLPRLALAGPPSDNPKVRQGRCRKIVLRSEAPLIVHTDGEFFCKPEDGIRELEVRVLPGALKVRTRMPG